MRIFYIKQCVFCYDNNLAAGQNWLMQQKRLKLATRRRKVGCLQILRKSRQNNQHLMRKSIIHIILIQCNSLRFLSSAKF